MVSIPFYYVARDVIGFLRSHQPATKLPGADARREEKVNSRLFEIALVLVRLDHVASGIVNANHGIMWDAEKLGKADGIADCIWPGVPQRTEPECITD